MSAQGNNPEQIGTPAVYYRGGTSKAVFVGRRDLPATNDEDLVAWILAIYGSPDKRQIDGMGGADLLTSKFAVVGPSTREDADVDYTFYQVGITEPTVSTAVNCGNVSSAVGPYAIDQGLVKATGETTIVRVHASNLGGLIHLTIPTHEGWPRISGDAMVQGVPGTGAPIKVDFRDMVGTLGKTLLPTGNLRDKCQVDGVGEVEVSIVDIGNVLCFIKAEYFGLDGTEMPDAMQEDTALMEKCEAIRLDIAVRLGIAKDLDEAGSGTLIRPWLVLVAAPKDWKGNREAAQVRRV
jgi:2-methylaconitate cis-trans-isomerase PrpF